MPSSNTVIGTRILIEEAGKLSTKASYRSGVTTISLQR